jgi:hypothetical protein
VQLHRRYENFSNELVRVIKEQYRSASILSDPNRKRNILRMLTELYFKGLIEEYKSFFGCLNSLIIDLRETDIPDYEEVFLNALKVVTDYLETYGERIFGVLAKSHRENINNDYEVSLPEN